MELIYDDKEVRTAYDLPRNTACKLWNMHVWVNTDEHKYECENCGEKCSA